MVDETYARATELLEKQLQRLSEQLAKLSEAMTNSAEQWSRLHDSLFIFGRVRVATKKKRHRKPSHKGRGIRHRYGKPRG